MVKKLKGRSKSSKSAVFTSDIHDGSVMSICSESPTVSDTGETYKPNSLQKALLNAWYESIDNFSQKPNICVVNGEPIDGPNSKQGGNQSWSTNFYDQAMDSIKLLKEIPSKEFLFTRGSGYHVQIEGTSIEQFVAHQMGGVRYSTLTGQESNAWYWADMDIHGKIFNMTHHIGYSRSKVARPNGLSREMVLMSLDKDRSRKYDVLVRSHVHYFAQVTTAHTTAFTTPAWKYPDGHLTRGGLGGVYPDVGMMEVIVEPNGEIIVRKMITEIKSPMKVYKVK